MKEPGQFAQSEYREAINNIGLSWGLMCDDDKARWHGLETERHDEYTRLLRLAEQHYDLYRDARSEVSDLKGRLLVAKETLKQMLGGDE
jgi:hypothetical protein